MTGSPVRVLLACGSMLYSVLSSDRFSRSPSRHKIRDGPADLLGGLKGQEVTGTRDLQALGVVQLGSDVGGDDARRNDRVLAPDQDQHRTGNPANPIGDVLSAAALEPPAPGLG